MFEEVAGLQIQVKSGEVKTATTELDKFTRASTKAEQATDSLKGSSGAATAKIAIFAAGIGLATLAVGQFSAAIQTTRQFQILQAGLKTATGSVANASKAFGILQQLAKETPYSLQEVVSGFTKLVNYGLNPGKEALLAYGDTAAALGKPLEQMIEAVADASNGEFERLKEFGIKASKEGDKITFMFRGVKTEIRNNAQEIESYLIKLAQNNFAGAMADRMNTLDGKFSNLGDAWEQFQFNLMTSSGAATAFSGVLEGLIEKIESLSTYITSGQLSKSIDLQKEQWSGLGRTITGLFDEAIQSSKDLVTESSGDSNLWDEYWKDAFENFPINLDTALKLGVTYLEWFLMKSMETADKWAQGFKIKMAEGVSGLNTIMGDFMASISNPEVKARWDEIKARELQAGSDQAKTDALSQGFSPLTGGAPETSAADDFLNKQLDTIVAESDAAKQRADLIRDQRDMLKDISDLEKQLQSGEWDPSALPGVLPDKGSIPQKDELASFRAPVAPDSGSSGGSKKGGGGSKTSAFEKLVSSLQAEEKAISSSYDRRLAMIQANTTAGSMAQTELSLSLVDQYEKDSLDYAESLQGKMETMMEGYALEEKALEDSYERRKQIILAATELTEEEKMRLPDEAHKKFIAQMSKNTQEQMTAYLDAADQFFGNLAQVGSSFGKKAFEVSKAAAIAQATIKMFESAVSAYAFGSGIGGPIVGGIMSAAAFAAGAANIASIKAQDYKAPGYATGGIIPGSSFSGDQVPARVNSGEMILNKSQQRNLFDLANGQGSASGKSVEVRVYNYGSEKVETKTSKVGDVQLVEFIVGRAKAGVAEDIRKGGTDLSKAMESTYALGRGRKAMG